MKVQPRAFNIKDFVDAKLPGHLERTIDDLMERTNERIDGSQRFSTTTPATANQEFGIHHGLGHIPNAFILSSQNKAGTLYKGTAAWTKTSAFFKFDGTSVDIEVIIW